MLRRLVPILAVALTTLFAGPAGAAAQDRPDEGVTVTNRQGAAPAPPSPPQAMKAPAQLAPDPFAWLRDAQAGAASEWRAQERRQRERWLAADPNYATLLDEARRSAPRQDAVTVAAGRLYARRAEDAGWRSRPLVEDPSRGVWRPEPALDGRGDVTPRLLCALHGPRACLLARRSAAGLTWLAYDPATGRVSPSPFAVDTPVEAAVLDGAGALLTASKDAGVSVVRRVTASSASGGPAPVLFRAAAGETVEPGAAVGAQGEAVVWLTVTDAGGRTALWVEAEGAFHHLAAPPGAAVVGVVGDQLVLLLRDGWPGAADLPAGALVALDLAPLLKRAPELTPHRILKLVSAPDVREAQATSAGLLLVVREGASDALYLCQPGMRGWAVRKLPRSSADPWRVVAVDAGADAVLLRASGFPGGDRLLQVGTRTGLTSQPLPDRPVFDGASSPDVHEATALDASHITYTVIHAVPGARPASLPILLLPSPRDAQEAEQLRAIGSLWRARGGDLAVAGRRSKRYDADNAYVDVLVSFEDLASIGRDLVTRGLAPGGRVMLAGVRTGASFAALDLVKHASQWRAVVLVDPVTDPLRADADADAAWAQLFADGQRSEARTLWRRVDAYEGLRPGPRYAPTLVVATPGGAPEFSTDGSRFTARLNEDGGNGLFVEAPDASEAAALAVAFMMRLSG